MNYCSKNKVNSFINALTIDVEDYFQVSAFNNYIDRKNWNSLECRVEKNIDKILLLLNNNNTRATFFTLGWIAKRYPGMIKKIIAEGHELASHGFNHDRVSDLTPEKFFQDVSRAKNLLEDIGGQAILGYRAPSFSIGKNNLWALEILEKTQHLYSSSIYPVQHDHYGTPDAPRFMYRTGETLLEIPPTTLRLFNRNIPASGGGYFRLYPYFLSKWMIERVNTHDKKPAVFYFHPWEIDAEQPKVYGLSNFTKFRHYININTTEEKLERLLKDFKWNKMSKIFLNN